MDEAKFAVPDADLILFLVDGSEPAGKGDKWIVENMLKDCKIPIILVMNKGNIIEQGTHQELMSIDNGKYKEMFNTQAYEYLNAGETYE